MFLTVFTPTYNRAYRLSALYESLCRQTNKDFEWLIVDDGSTDNTSELVDAWMAEGKVYIRYIHQSNGGKHRAINRGVKEAQGILFFIVDSDDVLPSNSVELIYNHYLLIKDRSEFGGLCGLKAYYNGSVIGGKNDFGILECTNYDIRYKHKLKGDLGEIFYTSVMKEYPFPEIDGERFCPEILIWNQISTKYKIHFFSDIIYNAEYLSDGLTAKITKLRIESPIASCKTYANMTDAPIPFAAKFRAAMNYWRFAIFVDSDKRPNLKKIWFIAFPFGWIMSLKDKRII